MNGALADYGRVVLSRWRWIMWGVLLALAAITVFLILSPPLYRSQATVFVRTPGDVSKVLDGGDSYAQGRARTYAALANSTSVTSRVIADLGLGLKPEVLSERIHATNPKGTALIDIAVSAPSGAEAQRTATVLLSEYATTVHMLEAVPGSVVPRAELVVVDPPGRPVRVVAWDVPIPVFLLCGALIGLVLGSTGAVLRSIFERPARAPDDAAHIAEPPAPDVTSAEPNGPVTVDSHHARNRSPMVMGDPDLHIDAPPIGSGHCRASPTSSADADAIPEASDTITTASQRESKCASRHANEGDN
jgi:capsular polysaccharide biosynthesis protein